MRLASEWLRVPAPHLRIVNEDLWRAAHARLEAGRSVYLAQTQGRTWGRPLNGVPSPYLLTGYTACATCGGGLITRTRGGAGRERWHTYICGSWYYRGGRVCGNKLEASLAKADRAVLGAIERKLFTPEVIGLTIQEGEGSYRSPSRGGRLGIRVVGPQLSRVARARSPGSDGGPLLMT